MKEEKYNIQAVYSLDDYEKVHKERNDTITNVIKVIIKGLVDLGLVALINNNISSDVLKIIGIAIFGRRCVENSLGGVLLGFKSLVDTARMNKNTTMGSIK